MPIITYRPRRIPARRFQQMLDAWLEQPLHGGLVLSRRGWPPAFLAHNAARAGVDSPRFVAGACPTRAGAGYLFLRLASIIHPYPSSIISSCSRSGEEKTASSSNDVIVSTPLVVGAPENLQGRGHVRGPRPITGYE